MRMIKALLCDIDGTLVQSNWLHAEAWQVAFRGRWCCTWSWKSDAAADRQGRR